MRKTLLAACCLVAASQTAIAGGQEGEIGIGAEFGLNGQTGGASVNYDAGKFHVGGFLGLFDDAGDDDTDYTLGARFYYHYSDDDGDPMTDRAQLMYLEPGAQIRLFLASNVALSFNLGISIGLVDEEGFALGGGIVDPGGSLGIVNATAGVHYYFF
jgi:hypothetical protein